MCYGCWKEAGKPESQRDEVKALAAMEPDIDHYGNLHILVDDWNCDDSHLKSCREAVAENRETEWFGKASVEEIVLETRYLDLMESLTAPERYAALALADGFYTLGR